MSIVVVDKLWDDTLSVQRGAFYGDVEHCVKDIRRRHPSAFAADDWAPCDTALLADVDSQQRAVLGDKPEFCVVWAGRFQSSCAYLVRSSER